MQTLSLLNLLHLLLDEGKKVMQTCTDQLHDLEFLYCYGHFCRTGTELQFNSAVIDANGSIERIPINCLIAFLFP